MHTVEESGARGFLFPGSRMISSGGYTHTGCEFFASPSYERSGSRRGVFSVVMPPHFV